MIRRRGLVLILIAAAAVLLPQSGLTAGDTVAEWDFTKGTHDWSPQSCIPGQRATAEGWLLQCQGEDPYIVGPIMKKLDYLEGVEMDVVIEMRVPKGEGAQMFFGTNFNEKDSVRFTVNPGDKLHTYTVGLPAMAANSRLRLDFPPDAGTVLLKSMSVTARGKIALPSYEDPKRVTVGAGAGHVVKAGDIELRHDGATLGGFEVYVAGKPMGCGYTGDLVAAGRSADRKYLGLKQATVKVASKTPLCIVASFEDPAKGRWKITRTFKAVEKHNAIEVETLLECDSKRDLMHAPVLTLLAGLGTFAPKKTQALFAGLEYLADEPSSSELDVTGPRANRLIPDCLKITFPLMAVHHDGRYVGLIWDESPEVCAVFDSPNRTWGKGGHLMAIAAPGVPRYRRENGLAAFQPLEIGPARSLKTGVTIVGGEGSSLVPAIKQYVAMKGLPELPEVGTRSDVETLMAAGWLDTGIAKEGLFEHALGWKGSPAADACAHLLRLSQSDGAQASRVRLEKELEKGLALTTDDKALSGVGHVTRPVPPLVFGDVAAAAALAEKQARAAAKAFKPDGSIPYEGQYARGHWTNEANGYAAARVEGMIAGASYSARKDLIDEFLRLTRALDKFDNTVPRGAQTWEIPLHTPDILASGRLVRVYVAAYELSGDKEFLERARYWAWTGLPFVYIRHPAGGPVGVYSTIAVYGATSWGGTYWIGLPVQWCGLVYAGALYELAEHDPEGPWLKMARGITLTGVQHSWPLAVKGHHGLLPDFFFLREQRRDGPAINPGTVQMNLPGVYGDPPYYRFRRAAKSGIIVHAPGSVDITKDEAASAEVAIKAWPKTPFYVAVSGMPGKPVVKADGKALPEGSVEYDPGTKLLVLKLPGSAGMTLNW